MGNEFSDNNVHYDTIKILKKTSPKITIEDVLKEIVIKYDVIDFSKYLTIDKIINKSYDIKELYNSIADDYDIAIDDIQEIIDNIKIKKNKVIEECHNHVLECNHGSQYNYKYGTNNGHVKCILCGCEYTCDSCYCTASFIKNHDLKYSDDAEEIKEICDTCERSITNYQCVRCKNDGCYCGCPKGCVCE